MQVLSAPGHGLLAEDGGGRAGARGCPPATPPPHRSSAGTGRPASSPPPPTGGPTGLGAPPPGSLGRVCPPRHWVRTAAHAPPWPTTHSNDKQSQEGWPLERPHTGLHRRPRVSALVCRAPACSTNAREALQLYGGAVRRGHGLTFSVAAPASASHHITSAGTQPSASPRLPRPIGRSHLSAGEITLAVLGFIRWLYTAHGYGC
jgi:hypothetical protein